MAGVMVLIWVGASAIIGYGIRFFYPDHDIFRSFVLVGIATIILMVGVIES